VAACGTAALAAAVLTAPQVIAGSMEPATAAVIVLLQLALVEPYAAMTTAVRQYPALRAVMRRVADSGVLEATATQAADGDGLYDVPPRPGAAPGVELSGLAAAWPGGGTVFSGLSATAGPGSWLAVTGPSGSGKSTLLAVLLGFLPAAGGRAAVTGTAAWCPQEAHLFDSTLRGNLLLGRPDGAGQDTADGAMAAALAAAQERAAGSDPGVQPIRQP
jgi:ATP-binding cassette subfamily C protein CydCD